jgi:hypothetical protein
MYSSLNKLTERWILIGFAGHRFRDVRSSSPTLRTFLRLQGTTAADCTGKRRGFHPAFIPRSPGI